MSYAYHQEEVARALHDLLRDRSAATRPDTTLVLLCRDQALKAIRDRLTYIAGDSEHATDRPIVTVASLAQRPVQHLAQVIHAVPLPAVPALPPSLLLPGPIAAAGTTSVDRWRCIARNLLLGTAELARADHQPWTHQPEAGWHLVGDLAVTLEAVLVLDEDLVAKGILAHRTEQRRIAQRLVAGHAARLARWFGTDDIADLASSGVGSELGVAGSPPVRIVRDATDYVPAQRTLTAVLRGQASVIRPGSDQRPGLIAARALATGQIRLAQTFANWADDAGEPALAAQFRSRISAWRALHVSTVRLVEFEQRRSPLLLAQQSEMVIRLRSPFLSRPSRTELHSLTEATHEVAIAAGTVLRHEALRTQNIVSLEYDDAGSPTPRAMLGPEWAFTTAAQRLVDDPPPVGMPQPPAAARQREQLHRSLEQTPVGSAPTFRVVRPGDPRQASVPVRDRAPSL